MIEHRPPPRKRPTVGCANVLLFKFVQLAPQGDVRRVEGYPGS
jgi:hypothetical protein